MGETLRIVHIDSPEVVQGITSYLEANTVLRADVSSYAKGRMRAWFPVEAPLSAKQKFKPGVALPRLSAHLRRITEPLGFVADVGLVSKGGSIEPHRDTTFGRSRAFGMNLGRCTWVYDGEEYDLEGGEVYEFNCKLLHSVQNVSSERWGVNVWEISDKTRPAFDKFINGE